MVEVTIVEVTKVEVTIVEATKAEVTIVEVATVDKELKTAIKQDKTNGTTQATTWLATLHKTRIKTKEAAARKARVLE